MVETSRFAKLAQQGETELSLIESSDKAAMIAQRLTALNEQSIGMQNLADSVHSSLQANMQYQQQIAQTLNQVGQQSGGLSDQVQHLVSGLHETKQAQAQLHQVLTEAITQIGDLPKQTSSQLEQAITHLSQEIATQTVQSLAVSIQAHISHTMSEQLTEQIRQLVAGILAEQSEQIHQQISHSMSQYQVMHQDLEHKLTKTQTLTQLPQTIFISVALCLFPLLAIVLVNLLMPPIWYLMSVLLTLITLMGSLLFSLAVAINRGLIPRFWEKKED